MKIELHENILFEVCEMIYSASWKSLIVAAVVTLNVACMASQETDRLKVIAESALSNRNAFPFITCRFRLRYGKSDNEDQALMGGPLRVKLTGNGIWIVRHDQVRYELIVDSAIERHHVELALGSFLTSNTSKKMNKSKKGTIEVSLGMRFISRKILWDGSKGMSYTPMLFGGGFLPPDQPSPGIVMTPFDLVGMMGRDECFHPGNLIEESKKRTGVSCRFAGLELVRGRNLLGVTYDDTSGRYNVHSEYCFDPKRGFLPVQVTKQSENHKQVRTKVVVTDVRECSGGRWFPVRSVKVLSPGPVQRDQDLDVFELTARELDVDTPPSDAMLVIDIPKGARLHNGIDPQSQSTLRQQQRISVADLSGVKQDMNSRARQRQIQHQQTQPLRKPELGRNWLSFGVCTALLVIVVITSWLTKHW